MSVYMSDPAHKKHTLPYNAAATSTSAAPYHGPAVADPGFYNVEREEDMETEEASALHDVVPASKYVFYSNSVAAESRGNVARAMKASGYVSALVVAVVAAALLA